jgi:hypothetical protein
MSVYTATYASVSYITSFCSDMGLTSWASLATTVKQAAAYRATAYMQSFMYKGQKTDETQELKWPRTGVYDEDVIPAPIKMGFARAAYEEGISPGSLLPTLTPSDYVTMKKVDVITYMYHVGSIGKPKIFQAVMSFLSPFIFFILCINNILPFSINNPPALFLITLLLLKIVS